MKREYPSTPQEAFESANEGLYYGAAMTKARQEGRIRRVYHDESLPVFTSWDLGFGDSTSIWFYQLCGQEIHLLEYYENSGESLPFYLRLIKDRPYSYLKHFVPHDAGAHEYSTGMTRVEVASKHGITFTIAPKVSIEEGIDAVRNMFNRCFFDEAKCAQGIRFLESYRRDWNDAAGCWRDRPKHDGSSHCCDAFRILAIGLGLCKPGMTAADAREIRERALSGRGLYSSDPTLPQINPFSLWL